MPTIAERRAAVARISAAPPLPHGAWDVLGVARGAVVSVWGSAYKKLAMLVHPDQCPLDGAADSFKKLAAARDLIHSGGVPNSAPAAAPPAAGVPPPFWRRRAAGGAERATPRDRAMRRAGTIADKAFNDMADGLGGAPMTDADLRGAVDDALRMKHVWVRSVVPVILAILQILCNIWQWIASLYNIWQMDPMFTILHNDWTCSQHFTAMHQNVVYY